MIAFIILHYRNINDTVECIKSIHQLPSKVEKKIIVVTNESSDHDIDSIRKYTSDIVQSKTNLGFANGNNLGCDYAIKKYKPDFLIVINNDTVMNQKNFIDLIYSTYKDYKFDILGPKILTNGGESVNPFPVYKTLDDVNYNINKNRKLIRIYSNILLRNLLKVYSLVKGLFVKKVHHENGKKLEKDIALHGCALIFSKKYYKKYKQVFYPGTFLYHEEEFLEYRRSKDHLITIYNPDIEIYHKEGASLDHRFSNKEYKKLIFRYTEINKSLLLLKDIMENNREI